MEQNIYLCQIPEIDLTQQRQIDFSTLNSQYTWFNNRTDKIVKGNVAVDTLTSQITLKTNLGSITKYDYLYLLDENGKRLFYFIIGKKKQNSNCIVYLKLDVFQTYMFNYDLQSSFIERCHVPRWINYNTPTREVVDEGLPLGEYIYYGEEEKLYQLKESYVVASTSPLGVLKGNEQQTTPGGGGSSSDGQQGATDPTNGIPSAMGYRYIKGFEGYSPYGCYHGNESFRTAGYGVTERSQPTAYKRLEPFPCSEERASIVFGDLLISNFANPVVNNLKANGIDMATVKSNHFDMMCSLAYNGGLGLWTGSPMYRKYLKNQDDPTIANDFLNYGVTSEQTGEVLPGLVARRKVEAEIWRTGIYQFRTIGQYNDRGQLVGKVTENNGHGFIPPQFKGGL